MTATLTLPPAIYPANAERAGFYDSLMRRVRGVKAIEAAAFASTLPFTNGESKQLVIDGRRFDESRRSSMVISITPGYFDALRLPLLQGRDFDESDGGPGRENIIVNESFAGEFFPEGGALGRRIAIGDAVPMDGATVPWLTIVGISPAVRQRRGTDSDPVIFVPWAAGAPATGALVVRSGLDTTSLVATLRQQVQAVDATMPIFRARTLPQVRHDSDWNGRLSSRLFLFLTFIAVALATVGLYAVTAHGVSQQRHEIGIRMALGARPVPDRAPRVAPRPGAGLHRIRRRDRLHGALGERLSFRRRRASCDRRRIAGHRGRNPARRHTHRRGGADAPGHPAQSAHDDSQRLTLLVRSPWAVVRGPREVRGNWVKVVTTSCGAPFFAHMHQTASIGLRTTDHGPRTADPRHKNRSEGSNSHALPSGATADSLGGRRARDDGGGRLP